MSGAATPQVRVVVLEWLVGLGVMVAVSTEALGFFGILTRLSVSLLWLAVAGAAVLSVARTGRWHVPTIRLPRDRELCLWMGTGALVIAIVGLIALAAAPGTADAMIYHLPRVMHWIANGSVDFYPTAIPRQLHMAPFAEYTILHSMLVTGRDSLVNVTQWVALVGGALAVSLITAQFGAPRAAQAFSAVLFLTAPIVLLEGSSTQNDLVAAMWCLLVVEFGLRRRVTTRTVVVTACALGLAALTKATTYLALAPFVPLVALTWRRQLSGPVRVRSLLLLVLMPLLLNAPQYVRDMDVTGSPLGPTTEGGRYKYTNDEWGLGFVSSNVVRNTAAELRSLSPFFNGLVQRAADRIHDGLGVAPDDPRTTWPDVTFDVMAPVRNEASSGNPLQFLLGIGAAFLLLIRPGPEAAAVRSYVVALLVAALLFCVVLRWQPWHPRLHISLIALSLPLVGTGLSGARHRSVRLALGLAAFLYATPFLVAGDDRPLLGASSVLSASRQSQYFCRRARPGGVICRHRGAPQNDGLHPGGTGTWAKRLRVPNLGPCERGKRRACRFSSLAVPGARQATSRGRSILRARRLRLVRIAGRRLLVLPGRSIRASHAVRAKRQALSRIPRVRGSGD